MAVLPRTTASLGKLVTASAGLWSNMKSSFSHAFTSGKNGLGTAGGFFGTTADRIGSATVRVASWPVKFASGTFKHFRVLAPVATVAAVAVGVGSYFNRRAERRTMAEFGQMDAMAQAQAQAASMGQAQANTYRLQPGEHAAVVEPLQKLDGQQQAFTAGIDSKRAAQAATGPAAGM